MASVFKAFGENDFTIKTSLLHESIPITGTIISGTYDDENIKDYTHAMWQSVYDYPYLSSSSNHIFDISMGVSTGSSLYSTAITASSKKANMYRTMAQVLAGFDQANNVREFDEDGSLAAGDKLKEVFFITFARLTTKDEIQKGTFSLTVLTGSTVASPDGSKTYADTGAANDFRTNSPAGEYGIIYDTGSVPAGLIYYQAGVAVLTASIFDSEFGHPSSAFATASVNVAFQSASIPDLCDGLRRRIQNVQFSSTTELNSKIYFCRLGHNEFNCSANSTYLSSSKILLKESPTDIGAAYFTSIGLYDNTGALLAVAKLSEVLRKDPTNEMILKVRMDY